MCVCVCVCVCVYCKKKMTLRSCKSHLTIKYFVKCLIFVNM